MKRLRIRSWEDLESLPEGEWVEVEEGMDFTSVDLTRGGRAARIIIPLDRQLAKSLATKKGEILEAKVRGDQLVLEKRRVQRRPARGRSH